MRVNVQLVNTETDSHLWADSYDRKLTDIFGVESEIAKGIAESLQAKLTGREEQALAVKPTNNPEAYDAYLRGLAFEGRSSSSYGSYNPYLVGQAAGFFERAVQLDPNFALAWARLSHMNAHLYFSGGLQSTSAQRDTAKRALDNAQKLEPTRPKPCSLWVIINITCWVITGSPRVRSGSLTRCYRVAARSHMPSAELPDARETGMKALPTSSKPSP